MTLNLPIHPSLLHPLTGEPLRALYVDKRGRARYPIMGGAPDDDAGDAGGADDTPSGDGDKDGKSDDAGGKTDDPPKGFPENTPRAQMKPAEQIAYDAFHGRKHEQRATEYREAAGGKTAAEVKAAFDELATLKQASLTDGERAVETAKAEGRREASLAIAPQMFDVALAHVDEDRRAVLIDTIDLSKVIKEDGTVDTAKVKTIADSLAPADKGPGGGRHDFGAGRRGGAVKSGVGAGVDMYQSSRKQKTT